MKRKEREKEEQKKEEKGEENQETLQDALKRVTVPLEKIESTINTLTRLDLDLSLLTSGESLTRGVGKALG